MSSTSRVVAGKPAQMNDRQFMWCPGCHYGIITRIIAGRDRFEIRNVEDFRRAEGALKSGTDAAFMIMARNPATNQYQSSFVPITIP